MQVAAALLTCAMHKSPAVRSKVAAHLDTCVHKSPGRLKGATTRQLSPKGKWPRAHHVLHDNRKSRDTVHFNKLGTVQGPRHL